MKMSTSYLIFWSIVGSAFTGFTARCVEAAPVGMTAQVKGSVWVATGGHKTPLRLLSRVEEGAAVSCDANSGATIVLFGGGQRYQVGANSTATFLANGVKGGKKMAALSGPSAGAVKLLGNARVGAVFARPPISFQSLSGNLTGLISPTGAQFAWQEIADASRYTFTLFDASDNVVWSVSTPTNSTSYPARFAPLVEKQPYLWKVSAFNAAGKRLLSGCWGFVTPLSAAETAALQSLANDLQAQAKATPADKTPLLILVDVYRGYGAVNSALNLLESEDLKGVPGVTEAELDLKDAQSPFARVLSQRGVAAVPFP